MWKLPVKFSLSHRGHSSVTWPLIQLLQTQTIQCDSHQSWSPWFTEVTHLSPDHSSNPFTHKPHSVTVTSHENSDSLRSLICHLTSSNPFKHKPHSVTSLRSLICHHTTHPTPSRNHTQTTQCDSHQSWPPRFTEVTYLSCDHSSNPFTLKPHSVTVTSHDLPNSLRSLICHLTAHLTPSHTNHTVWQSLVMTSLIHWGHSSVTWPLIQPLHAQATVWQSPVMTSLICWGHSSVTWPLIQALHRIKHKQHSVTVTRASPLVIYAMLCSFIHDIVLQFTELDSV